MFLPFFLGVGGGGEGVLEFVIYRVHNSLLVCVEDSPLEFGKGACHCKVQWGVFYTNQQTVMDPLSYDF